MLTKIANQLNSKQDKYAFYIDSQMFTYKRLSKIVNSISEKLSKITVKNSVIGIYATKNIYSYASLLSVLFTGNTFVILNPKFPLKRNLTIIQNSDISLILSSDNNQELNNLAHSSGVPIIYNKNLENTEKSFIFSPGNENSLAYILYTSGSTGEPKGVKISLKNLNTFIESFFATGIKFSSKDKVLQMFDLSFDVSVATTLLPLISGSCIYSVSDTNFKYPEIYKLIKEHRLTVLTIVPSILSFFKPFFSELKFPSVKTCILTAEPSFNAMVKEWSNCIPNADIYNFYGPTEATIWCYYYMWEKTNFFEKGYKGYASIGKPLKNIFPILVDEKHSIISESLQKGELCLAGDQISIGYHNNQSQNKSSFFIKENKRYYKTGDICFFDNTGDYMLCGRVDDQVQVQGYRVELSEITSPIIENFKVSNAVALSYRAPNNLTEIALFLENYSGKVSDIRSFLEKNIPQYMIPHKIVILPEFPINESNKVDRIELLTKI